MQYLKQFTNLYFQNPVYLRLVQKDDLLGKQIDGVALFVADPPPANSNTMHRNQCLQTLMI